MRSDYMAVLQAALNLPLTLDEAESSRRCAETVATAGESEHPGCHRKLTRGALATFGAVAALYHSEISDDGV